MASLAAWKRGRLLQTELDQGLAGHLDRLALLGNGPNRSNGSANGRSHPRIPGHGADRRAETSPAKKTLGASLAAALAFDFVAAGEDGIGRAVHHDIGEFQLQFG